MDWKKGETCSCSYDMLCEYSSLPIKYPQAVFDFTVTIFIRMHMPNLCGTVVPCKVAKANCILCSYNVVYEFSSVTVKTYAESPQKPRTVGPFCSEGAVFSTRKDRSVCYLHASDG